MRSTLALGVLVSLAVACGLIPRAQPEAEGTTRSSVDVPQKLSAWRALAAVVLVRKSITTSSSVSQISSRLSR